MTILIIGRRVVGFNKSCLRAKFEEYFDATAERLITTGAGRSISAFNLI